LMGLAGLGMVDTFCHAIELGSILRGPKQCNGRGTPVHGSVDPGLGC
jgi:hypothetical protein